LLTWLNKVLSLSLDVEHFKK